MIHPYSLIAFILAFFKLFNEKHFSLRLCPFGKCGALHLGPFTYLLTYSLPFSLRYSGRKLEKSVNIDARTLKFCMSHPWTQSLRFRENQIVCMSLSLLVGLLPY